MLHQGVEHTENSGRDSQDKHEYTGPSRKDSKGIEKNPGHTVDTCLNNDAGKQGRDVAGRDRVSRGQPGMKRNDTGFNAETKEKQHKRSGLVAARQLCRAFMEARELGAATGLSQESKTEEQAPGVDVSHDDVQ